MTATGAAEGVVIAPDGTLYFSQSFNAANPFIGRYRPGMAVERQWVQRRRRRSSGSPTIPSARRSTPAAGALLPPSSRSTSTRNRQPPEVLAPAEMTINGVTLGEDDAVYYSRPERPSHLPGHPRGDEVAGDHDRAARGPQRHRLRPRPGRQPVRRLLGRYPAGHQADPHQRRRDRARGLHRERRRGNADGAAFDEMGRLYVSAGGLLRRIAADGSRVEMMMASNGANIEFGAGALRCTDVYVGSNGGGIVRHTLDVKGANVPWHRQP